MKTTLYLKNLARSSVLPSYNEVKKIVAVWYEDLFKGEYLNDATYLESIDNVITYLDSLESRDYIEDALEYWQYMKRNKQHQIL